MAGDTGGGLFATGSTLTVNFGTITGNNAIDGGGGILTIGLVPDELAHSIVAGNTRGAGVRDDILGPMAVSFSLIGDNTGATITNNGGNLIGTAGSPINPLLGPLADNGGPTFTHALLPESPAIDAGDAAAVAGAGGVPQFDQRGDPFSRVADGNGAGGLRIDIGAYEFIPSEALPTLFGDYNHNGIVDAADYTVWRNTLGNGLDAVQRRRWQRQRHDWAGGL